jgi:hypothetical protein
MTLKKLLSSIIITCLLLSGSAFAAEEQSTKDLPVFDLSFPGGTVAEFVTQVEKAFDQNVRPGAFGPDSRAGQKPNFIVPAEASSVKLPKLELRSVDVDTLMKAVTALLISQPQRQVWQRIGGSTWVLSIDRDSRSTRAFYVGHLLKKFKIEDITTAVETVLQMGRPADIDLKYHKDTQLLILRASKAQLDSALEVLNQLRDALALDTPDEASQTTSKKPSAK